MAYPLTCCLKDPYPIMKKIDRGEGTRKNRRNHLPRQKKSDPESMFFLMEQQSGLRQQLQGLERSIISKGSPYSLQNNHRQAQ